MRTQDEIEQELKTVKSLAEDMKQTDPGSVGTEVLVQRYATLCWVLEKEP